MADYLDAPAKDVKARWPTDTVEVSVDGEQRWVLAADEAALAASPVHVTRLLGPFDLFWQAKDRQLLVDDTARAKQLWPALGRPGAVLHDGDIAGMWRPRKTGKRLRLHVQLWTPATAKVQAAIAEQAERLAGHRQVALASVDFAG